LTETVVVDTMFVCQTAT